MPQWIPGNPPLAYLAGAALIAASVGIATNRQLCKPTETHPAWSTTSAILGQCN